MKIINRLLAATLAFAGCLVPAQLIRADDSQAVIPADPSAVAFEDATLDLAQSWGDAQACIEIDGAVECYRSERQLDAAHPEFSARQSSSFVALASCSSSPTGDRSPTSKTPQPACHPAFPGTALPRGRRSCRSWSRSGV